jgi:hypothetical protein
MPFLRNNGGDQTFGNSLIFLFEWNRRSLLFLKLVPQTAKIPPSGKDKKLWSIYNWFTLKQRSPLLGLTQWLNSPGLGYKRPIHKQLQPRLTFSLILPSMSLGLNML